MVDGVGLRYSAGTVRLVSAGRNIDVELRQCFAAGFDDDDVVADDIDRSKVGVRRQDRLGHRVPVDEKRPRRGPGSLRRRHDLRAGGNDVGDSVA